MTGPPPPRLDVALRQILRLAGEDPDYEPQVRAFMVRFISELDPKPLNIRKLADCFECLQTWFRGEEARAGLEMLVLKLETYERLEIPAEEAVDFQFEGKVERLE